MPFLLAADAPGGLTYTPPASPPPPDPAGLVLKLFLLTAGTIGACAGVVWLARRTNRPPAVPADSAGRLVLEGSLPLPRRCSVHLVKADGHTVAVTTDATGLRSMVLLSEPFQTMLDEAGGAGPG
jgi:hypothetical protein